MHVQKMEDEFLFFIRLMLFVLLIILQTIDRDKNYDRRPLDG